MITARTSRTRRPATVAALVAGALALGGCSLTNPTSTEIQYAPSDGISIDGQGADVRNLLVVSHGDGSPAVVSGVVVNQTDQKLPVKISVAGAEAAQQLEVAPRSAVNLAPAKGDVVTVPSLESPAGQSVQITVTAGTEQLSAAAPVVLPQGAYERYAQQAGGPVSDDAAATSSGH